MVLSSLSSIFLLATVSNNNVLLFLPWCLFVSPACTQISGKLLKNESKGAERQCEQMDSSSQVNDNWWCWPSSAAEDVLS